MTIQSEPAVIALDPINYEVFVRRLTTVLEEGRQAVAMTSGSPAIVEGGEFMTSLYEEDGKGILTAAGTLFHVMGSADSIRHAIREYEDNPGINDGDQFFYNDPYIAGTHVYDQIVVKPIFYQGRCVAWVGTMTHTGDVGGVLRGISSEIFHEGVRIRGVKVVEGYKVRKDILGAITGQCRDPEYVAQDILARIAANNVCAEGYLSLVERFGIEFVKAAGKKLRKDAEKMFRERLRKIPDGTWRERVYMSTTKRVAGKEEPSPSRVVCTMTKKGDQLSFEIIASPQVDDYRNAALPSSRSCLFAALAASILWDIPWNSDIMDWVSYSIPEGTYLNCRFPASCGLGTAAGITLICAAAGCMARMMYAAGLYDYVNACWGPMKGTLGGFGPGAWFGGHSQHGRVVGQGTYDQFAGGQGATPYRDGNDTGGVYTNARSASSDVEWTETYYPLLFFAQRQGVDSGGYGKFRGGMNLESLVMVYGTRDLTTDFLPGPEGGEARGWGLFGGYPTGSHLGDSILLLTAKEDLVQRFSQGVYPTKNDELGPPWGINARQSSEFGLERQLGGIRVSVPEYALIGYSFRHGSGYGDPLDRDPLKVVEDVKDEVIAFETAVKMYGVVVHPETLKLDLQKTQEKRQEIRQERLEKGKKLTPEKVLTKVEPGIRKRSIMRIHEYLEIVEKTDGSKIICCIKCSNEFCPSGDNYKKYALRWVRDLREMKKVSQGEKPITHYQEYICPGCGTLLSVDVWSPLVDTDEPLWDIDIIV